MSTLVKDTQNNCWKLPTSPYKITGTNTVSFNLDTENTFVDADIDIEVKVDPGSATGPSSLSGSSASVTTGTNTITLTKTGVTTTPTVSAGYVSSATASTATVALTADITTKGATTYHPSTTDQTIASDTYITGAQTIKGVTVSNLSAENIKKDVVVKIGDSTDDDCVTSVTGSYEGGGGTLTTKTATPNDNLQFVTNDTLVAYRNQGNFSNITFTAGTVYTTPSIYFDSGTLENNTEYRIIGKLGIYKSSHEETLLEYYNFDNIITWSSIYQTLYENENSTYIQKIQIKRGSSTTMLCQYTSKVSGKYSLKIEVYFYENGTYNGLDGVIVNTPKYKEVVIKDFLSVSTGIYDIPWPDDITKIRQYCFYGMQYFNPSSLPSTITSIGDYAFSGCTGLTLTSLPSGITSIGIYAFHSCTNLALTSLPSGLTSIGQYTFYNCKNLVLTSLPSGLTSIGRYAFSGCTSLALTSLPSGLTSIAESGFSGCTNLALTNLPSGLTSIGQYTFYSCTELALTSLPNGITTIHNYTFYNSGIQTMTLPSTITSLSTYCFGCCSNLLSISGDGNITSISSSAFLGNSTYPASIKTASFPNAIITSLSTAFGNATAANACQQLEFVDLGSTGGIAVNAFANCYSLTTIILRKSASICNLANISAFLNTPLRGYNSQTATVYVPNALISTYKTATNWSTIYNAGALTFSAIEGSDYEL